MDQIKDVIEDEEDDGSPAERQNSHAEASTSDPQASYLPFLHCLFVEKRDM